MTAIEFEHAPGRGDLRFTDDRSAFDVYVEFTSNSGTRGFIGIEVKYHEGLGDRPAPHRPRYDEVAAAMGSFKLGACELLRVKPLQQIWRDHLLAGSLLLERRSDFGEGLFVFLYPEQNDRCARAVALYRRCLTDTSTFRAWTLDEVVGVLRDLQTGAWLEAFADRYMGFARSGFDRARSVATLRRSGPGFGASTTPPADEVAGGSPWGEDEELQRSR
ncbi:MAG: hypothetical protein IPG04_16910 [Polyangiaceae bacterium]|nr:hypothetical protein [Polyangiaceae bacterium]